MNSDNDERTDQLPVHRDKLLVRLRELTCLYHAGQLDGTSHEVHPSLEHGSRENYLYFTLAPALNFQRKSEGLWRSALATYQDPSTRFVFDPALVCEKGDEAVRYALAKHNLALLRERHTWIWVTLSRTFHEQHDDDPRTLLRKCDNDVVRVLEYIKKHKTEFPYLSGPKLSNYWLYILSHFTDIQLKNRRALSVIPDVHVIRATVRLGLLEEKEANAVSVAKVWENVLVGTEFTPSDLHAPLWRWSRREFEPDL